MLALTQMASMRRADGDLAAAHAERVAERAAAVEEVLSRSGWPRRALLRWANRLLQTFAGERDTAKYFLTLYNERVRRAALSLGQRLVDEHRLDRPEQVFSLRLDEVRHRSGDLRARCARNTTFLHELAGRTMPFPPVIDSRGRILRPPAAQDEQEGTVRGMGVSPGVATGRVRRLYRAEGAVVEPGEVLVAYTTDPGWTPLFVHAAAVVLEIGGTLQHGALVAREYGKPCVVGVSQVLERLEDGQLVEVDGFAGVVRVIDEPGQGSAGAGVSA
jgi:pyruvate,water dikinase